MPTVEDALQGPGTLLADGLSVVDGSWLVGAVFPHSNGWDAVLVVDEQPLQAFDAQLEQAAAAGFTDFAFWPSSSTCIASLDLPQERRTVFTDLAQAPSRADDVHCSIGARRAHRAGRVDTLNLEMYLGRPDSCATECTQSYASHLEISFGRSDEVADALISMGNPQPAPPEIGALTLPQLPPPHKRLRLPGVGERMGVDHRFFEAFEVEDGSEVLAPATGLNAGGTGNFTVLLRITGDPRAVLEAYGRQFGKLCCPDERFELSKRATELGDQFGGGVSESGGIAVSVATTALEAGEPVFARVDIGND